MPCVCARVSGPLVHCQPHFIFIAVKRASPQTRSRSVAAVMERPGSRLRVTTLSKDAIERHPSPAAPASLTITVYQSRGGGGWGGCCTFGVLLQQAPQSRSLGHYSFLIKLIDSQHAFLRLHFDSQSLNRLTDRGRRQRLICQQLKRDSEAAARALRPVLCSIKFQ